MTRHDLSSLRALYDQPFFDLISQARETYRTNWAENEVQLCTLMSIKTGGCSEDCSYCAQSAHYDTGLAKEALLPLPQILATAETRAGQWQHAVLHGRGVEGDHGERSEVSLGTGDGARGEQAGHGGVRDAGAADARGRTATPRRRGDGV